MLMKRMSILLGWCFALAAIQSNGPEANRHETEIFFRANYAVLFEIEVFSSCPLAQTIQCDLNQLDMVAALPFKYVGAVAVQAGLELRPFFRLCE
jgi:hypothetical protein